MANDLRIEQPATTAEPLLNHNQAAAFLNILPRTLTLWRYERGLPFIRISKKVVRYRRSDINQWLDRRRTVISC